MKKICKAQFPEEHNRLIGQAAHGRMKFLWLELLCWLFGQSEAIVSLRKLSLTVLFEVKNMKYTSSNMKYVDEI